MAGIFLAASLHANGQGTLVFDQWSAANPLAYNDPSVDFFDIQTEPLTQSFVPTLSAIGFVQFEFIDAPGNGNNGATVYVNLWTGSPNINFATLLGSTAPVFMPNGFGFGFGVTNFYFSTQISLNPGQTYYLQPVVQSGDDPWDVMVLADTYANGQLFARGNFIQPSSDLWFREGILVPEPSALALFGVGGVLFFARKRFRNSAFIISLMFLVGVARADVTSHVFYLQSLGGVESVPYPIDPYDGAYQVEQISRGVYLIEDGPPPDMGLPSDSDTFDLDDPMANTEEETNVVYQQYDFSPSELALESAVQYRTNLWLWLWGTVYSENYQLLSTTNLSSTNWDLGEIIFGDEGVTGFSAIPMTNSMRFFRAHHAMPILALYDDLDTIVPDSTNNTPGQIGIIGVYDETDYLLYEPTNRTVYYTVSGTARGGIDYSNLPGVITIPADTNYAAIPIQPIENGLKPDQTVILKLVQNTNYLIDPHYLFATNILFTGVYPVGRGDKQFPCPNTAWSGILRADDPRNLPLTYSIVTLPTHGTLTTNSLPSVTYTPTNCFEGQDSFTFKVSNGEFESAPATVTLYVADPIHFPQATPQTCRGTPIDLNLTCSDDCGETLIYDPVSNPSHGSLSSPLPSPTYTPADTNFTGLDTFTYRVTDECGYSTTGSVSIVVGSARLRPDDQTVMTGTNRPVSITLSTSDFDSCTGDPRNYTYTIVTDPAHGTLTPSGTNWNYAPTNYFEGVDSFRFVVNDGAWTSTNSATVTSFVVAGPILITECDPFVTSRAVQLTWGLDEAVQQMQQQGLSITDFIIYRGSASGGPYTAIHTNPGISMSYSDTNIVAGQTNYYVVTFEASVGLFPAKTYESPYSNEFATRNPDRLVAPDAIWHVVDITFTNRPPDLKGDLQAPFSDHYPNQYSPTLPLPNTYWPINTTWSNHFAFYVPSNTVLSQVKYSIAIDNECWLYLNHSTNYIDSASGIPFAVWSSFKSFESIAPGLLHHGINDIDIVIHDYGVEDYFSMVVTTNTCGR